MVEPKPVAALFVIDDKQRIVQWSHTASALLGVQEESALGEHCYDIIGGHDSFGRDVCRDGCPAFKGLQSGNLTGRSALVLPEKDATENKFRCELTALPGSSDGALVTLSARESATSPRADGDMPNTLAVHRIGDADENLIHDLAAVATLSNSLSPDHVDESIDHALKWLREAANADAAELFLAEPQGNDMLLAAYQGPFKTAFSQVTRFKTGEGFPGLVQAHGQPIVTGNLSDDPRYLRNSVKERGFLSYVCVPLPGPKGVMGVLNLASRRPEFDVDRALRLLTWCSRPISNMMQAGYLLKKERLGQGIPRSTLNTPESNFDDLLQQMLEELMTAGGAAGGTLLLYDSDAQGVARRAAAGEFAGVVCPDMRTGEPRMCPALVDGHGLALSGARDHWPAACHQVPAGAAMVYCLPLKTAGRDVGIVQLGYKTQPPSPPTKHLPGLLDLAEQAASVIQQEWTSLQRQERVLSQIGLWTKQAVPIAQPIEVSTEFEAANAVRNGGTSRPVLEIQCFGAFELRREGRLVPTDTFKRRGALTLLKILLTQNGRPLSKDALGELLWPEADPLAVANRLYGVVHALRQAVEPNQRGKNWLFVRNEGDHYFFNPDSPYRLDVRNFREYVALGERMERVEDLPAAISAYEFAVDLYKGDLLNDEPYSEWCWEEREHLREVCLTVLRKLSPYYLKRDPNKSVELSRRALRIDPLREESHQELMRALWESGRRDEALRQYQICADTLARDLDVAPLRETQELYARIRAAGAP